MSLSQIVRARSLRGSLFAAVSALALSGCVSAVNEQFDNTAISKPNTVVATVSDGNSDDEAGTAEQVPALAQAPDVAEVAAGEADNQMAGLVTQPTGIAATQNSIFANAAQPSAANDASEGNLSAPAFVPLPSANPAVKSLYQQDLASQAAAIDAQNNKLHAVVTQQEAKSQVTPQVVAAAPSDADAPQPAPAPKPQVAAKPQKSGDNTVTLAAFFAAAARKRSSNGFNSTSPVESLAGPTADQLGIAFGGRSSMGETFDDEHEEDTPPPAGLMKLASLGSLSRVAPNGLRLQTEKVSVACMKPELIRRIKAIEAHYKRPVVVTSGYRPRVNNVRRGSLHHSCDAADVQVSGVSKWELAKYLRAQPDRGGVGTYCHTESVHLDTGEARDWNWRCRAPQKKS